MNGVQERYEVKLKQTSKGIWFCDGITLANKNDQVLMIELDEFMGGIEDMLAKHNGEEKITVVERK